MRRQIIECVANFSEGRDASLVESIAHAVEHGRDVRVLHVTLDADHHRSVITFAGTPDAVLPAAVRAVSVAVGRIDLTAHTGVHPRLGAADVVPLVPVENITLEECAELAHRLGDELWRATGVPVYFYEAAALRPDRRLLENVRRGGFEGIRAALASGDDTRRPDIGGPTLHPTAGAVIVGARKFLIAWNVNLASTDLAAAKAIARKIRASSGGFPCLKALGLPLQSRGQVQVSMNLTDFDVTPMHTVFEAICRQAHELGIEVAGTEIIGLLPRAVLERAAASWFRFENFHPDVVLEQKIESLLRL